MYTFLQPVRLRFSSGSRKLDAGGPKGPPFISGLTCGTPGEQIRESRRGIRMTRTGRERRYERKNSFDEYGELHEAAAAHINFRSSERCQKKLSCMAAAELLQSGDH